MGDRSSGWLLIPFIAVLAFIVPGGASTPREQEGASPAARSEAPATAQAAAGSRTAEALLREYHYRGTPPRETAAAGAVDLRVTRGGPGSFLVEARQPASTPPPGPVPRVPRAERCLIATLPDPRDAANLNYMSDRYLDAAQRAMEAAGYVLDRFDVPPLDERGAERFRREPGRLLFRRTGSAEMPAPTAILFIVGETPTAGIHKAAFSAALAEMDAACGEGPTGEREPPGDPAGENVARASPPHADAPSRTLPFVPVLGPSFSGSQDSLDALLERHATHRFRIVAGSATALDHSKLMRRANVEFATTIARDESARTQFLYIVEENERRRAVQRLGLVSGTPKVALLVEGNTSFGRSALPRPDADGATRLPGVELTELSFPLHISRLRMAAQEEDAATETLDLAPRRRALTTLDLRGSGTARTVLPQTSQLETASMEIVLTSLLETLEEADHRYVGIVATDIQDLLFLSRQVRHHLPNSQLVLFTGDLLFLHPDVNVDLRGAMIVSSYPLFPGNHEWTPTREQAPRLLFPSDTTQGVYNAALVLLDRPGRLQEYGFPLTPPDAASDSRGGRGMPLWLSVVGAERLWPIRLFELPAREMLPRGGFLMAPGPAAAPAAIPYMFAAPAAAREAEVATPSHPWLALIALAFGCLPAFYVLATMRPTEAPPACSSVASMPIDSTPPPPSGAPSRWRTGVVAELFSGGVFGDSDDPLVEPPVLARRTMMHRMRQRYLFHCWAAIATSYFLLAGVLALPLVTAALDGSRSWSRTWLDLGLEALLIAGMVLMFIVLCRLAVRAVRDECRTHRGMRAAQQTLLRVLPLVPVLLAVVLAGIWLLSGGRTTADAVLLYLRSTELDSGVSPLVPLVLLSAAGLVWAVTSLRRLRLLEGCDQYPAAVSKDETSASYLGFDAVSFAGVAALEQQVRDVLRRRSTEHPGPLRWTVVGAILLACYGMFGRRGVPSPDGNTFDLLFATGYVTICVAMTLSLYRLLIAWRRLSWLLRRLAWHPTIKAYDRLSKVILGKPKVNLTAQSQIFTALEFSIERAGEMITKARELTSRAAAAPGTSDPPAPAFTHDVRARLGEMEAHVKAAQHALQVALAAAARADWRLKVVARTCAEQHLSCIARVVTGILLPAWRPPAQYWLKSGTEKPDEVAWFQIAEDFLTSRVAGFLSHIVPQLQNLVVCTTAGLLLLLLAVTSYPFQPRQNLLFFTTLMIVLAVGATLWLFVQMERDTILSALSDTAPGHVSWSRDFVARIAVYIVVPLLGVLTAQFPEVAQQLVSWTRSLVAKH